MANTYWSLPLCQARCRSTLHMVHSFLTTLWGRKVCPFPIQVRKVRPNLPGWETYSLQVTERQKGCEYWRSVTLEPTREYCPMRLEIPPSAALRLKSKLHTPLAITHLCWPWFPLQTHLLSRVRAHTTQLTDPRQGRIKHEHTKGKGQSLQEMVRVKLAVHVLQVKSNSHLTPYIKTSSRCVKSLNVRPKAKRLHIYVHPYTRLHAHRCTHTASTKHGSSILGRLTTHFRHSPMLACLWTYNKCLLSVAKCRTLY